MFACATSAPLACRLIYTEQITQQHSLHKIHLYGGIFPEAVWVKDLAEGTTAGRQTWNLTLASRELWALGYAITRAHVNPGSSHISNCLAAAQWKTIRNYADTIWMGILGVEQHVFIFIDFPEANKISPDTTTQHVQPLQAGSEIYHQWEIFICWYLWPGPTVPFTVCVQLQVAAGIPARDSHYEHSGGIEFLL